jgi:hypothetical protein
MEDALPFSTRLFDALYSIMHHDLHGGIRNAFSFSKNNKLRKTPNLEFDARTVVDRLQVCAQAQELADISEKWRASWIDIRRG